MLRVRRDARKIAARYHLAIGRVRRLPGNADCWGLCAWPSRDIWIAIHDEYGDILPYDLILDTLCHELAHVRHFTHSPDWRRLYLRMLRWARAQRKTPR